MSSLLSALSAIAPRPPKPPVASSSKAGRNLKAAIPVAIILLAAVAGSVVWRIEVFVALIGLALCLALWEAAGAFLNKGIRIPLCASWMTAIATVIVTWYQGITWGFVVWFLGALVVFSARMFSQKRFSSVVRPEDPCNSEEKLTVSSTKESKEAFSSCHASEGKVCLEEQNAASLEHDRGLLSEADGQKKTKENVPLGGREALSGEQDAAGERHAPGGKERDTAGEERTAGRKENTAGEGKDTPEDQSLTASRLRDSVAGVFALAWIVGLGMFAVEIARLPNASWIVALLILMPAASDTGGWMFGVMWGKHPMSPTISPKKTWEGFLGSLALATVVAFLLGRLALDFSATTCVVIGISSVFCATIGDLSESLLKRDLGVKDMGSIFPGHGGMLDRIDSILMWAPACCLIAAVAA